MKIKLFAVFLITPGAPGWRGFHFLLYCCCIVVVLLLYCARQNNSNTPAREQQNQIPGKGRDFNIWRNNRSSTMLEYFSRVSLEMKETILLNDFTVLLNDFTVLLNEVKHLLPISPVVAGDPSRGSG